MPLTIGETIVAAAPVNTIVTYPREDFLAKTVDEVEKRGVEIARFFIRFFIVSYYFLSYVQ